METRGIEPLTSTLQTPSLTEIHGSTRGTMENDGDEMGPFDVVADGERGQRVDSDEVGRNCPGRTSLRPGRCPTSVFQNPDATRRDRRAPGRPGTGASRSPGAGHAHPSIPSRATARPARSDQPEVRSYSRTANAANSVSAVKAAMRGQPEVYGCRSIFVETRMELECCWKLTTVRRPQTSHHTTIEIR